MAASLEVSGWRAELEGLLARFGRLFVRAEPREQAGRYLEGLLGPIERKNGWQLAEHLGDARPWRTRPGWRGSTAAPWARSRTARSGSSWPTAAAAGTR